MRVETAEHHGWENLVTHQAGKFGYEVTVRATVHQSVTLTLKDSGGWGRSLELILAGEHKNVIFISIVMTTSDSGAKISFSW